MDKRKIPRALSKSVTEDKKESLQKQDGKSQKPNFFYLFAVLRKIQAAKCFRGFIKIVSSTNKSYARDARLRNLMMVLQFKKIKNMAGGFRKIKQKKIKHRILINFMRRICNASGMAQKIILKEAFFKVYRFDHSAHSKSLEKIKKPPFSKKIIQTKDTPIREMKESMVSESSISVSRSNKSLSNMGSRVRRKSVKILPEDFDPSTLEMVKLKEQNESLKIMKLSQEAIESLKKLQRFDRFIYPLESDRILKKPIEKELRRLQKIKNLRVDMRGEIFDTELLVTALYNHIKLIYEMNRELEEREVLRKQKNEAEKKVHEIKLEKNKEVRDLKDQLLSFKNMTPIKIDGRRNTSATKEFNVNTTPQSTPLKRQEQTTLNFITATLKGNKLTEAMEQIHKFIEKSEQSHAEMCQIFNIFLPFLQRQYEMMNEHKNQSKMMSDHNIVIEKVNRALRSSNAEQLERMKNEMNITNKNISLFIEISLNNLKTIQQHEQSKVPKKSENNKSLEKINQQMKTTQEQIKQLKKQLLEEKSQNAENLKIKVSLEKQLEKYQKAEAEGKNKESIAQRNQAEELEKLRQELAMVHETLGKISKSSQEENPKAQLEKIKKMLAVNITSRRLIPITDTVLTLNSKYSSLETQIEKLEQEKVKRSLTLEKKNQEQTSSTKQQSINLSQILKSSMRSWNKIKPEVLLQDKKLITILKTEIEKYKLGPLENVSSELLITVENIVSIFERREEERVRVENGRKEDLERSQEVWEEKFREMEREKNKGGEENWELKNENKKLKAEIEKLEKIREKNFVELENLRKNLRDDEEKWKKENSIKEEKERNKKINKQLSELRNQNTRLINENQVLENRNTETNQQIMRLKKLTESYVSQERKILQALQREQKSKEQYESQLQNSKRYIDRLERQKDLFSNNLKKSDNEMMRFKEMELMYNSAMNQFEVKFTNIDNELKNKQKEVKIIQERNQLLADSKNKCERDMLEMERNFQFQKQQWEGRMRSMKENADYVEKQRLDLSRENDRLNQQVKFQMEERDADIKHYGGVIAKLERSIQEKERLREAEVRELEGRIGTLMREKESMRVGLESEEVRYRDKIKELSQDLSYLGAGSSHEVQRVDLHKRIERLSSQIQTLNKIHQSQKTDFKSQICTLNSQLQCLLVEKNQQKRIYREDIERARTQEYQINYQKIKKQREEMRSLQEEIDKLTEIIEINENNYNKIVEDNKEMYERILELEYSNSGLAEENDRLKQGVQEQSLEGVEVNEYINSLEVKIREFERVVSSGGHSLDASRANHDLQVKIEELNNENIKLRVQLEQSLKVLTKTEQQTHHLRQINLQLDRQIYSTRQSAKLSETLARTSSQQELEQLYEHRYQTEIRNLNDKVHQLSQDNYELMQARATLQNEERRAREMEGQIKELVAEKGRVEGKLMKVEKEWMIKEMSWKQEMVTLESKVKSTSNWLQEGSSLKSKISELSSELQSMKSKNFQLEKTQIRLAQELQQKEKTIEYLEKEQAERKTHDYQRDSELKTYFHSINRTLEQSASNSQLLPDLSSTVALLERNLEDKRRELQRANAGMEAATRKLEMRNVEYAALQLEVRHGKMEREMLENNLQTRISYLVSKSEDQQRQIDSLSHQLTSQRSQHTREVQRLISEKKHSDSQNQSLQQKYQQNLKELNSIVHELTKLKTNPQQGSNGETTKMLTHLSRELEENRREFKEREEDDRRQIAKLREKAEIVEQAGQKELNRVREDYERRVAVLQREVESKKGLVDRKEREINEYIQKLAISSTQSLNPLKQEHSLNIKMLEKTIESLKTEQDRLHQQIHSITTKLQQKIHALSTLSLENKQLQLEKGMMEDSHRGKQETLMEKNSDLSAQINSLKLEIKNMSHGFENEKRNWGVEREGLMKRVAERERRGAELEREVEMLRRCREELEENRRSMKERVKSLEERNRFLQDNGQHVSKKFSQENRQLKQIISLFDKNYTEEEEDGQDEMRILIRISEEISDLITRNKHLERQLAIMQYEMPEADEGNRDEEWFSSIQILIESLLAHLSHQHLLNHQNVSSFIYHAEFKGQSLYASREKYCVYVESFLKELFDSIVDELSENNECFENTLEDCRVLVEEFYQTGDRGYIDSMRKCLSNL